MKRVEIKMQINIKNIPEEILSALKLQAKESKAANFSQYIIEIFRSAIVNNGLSIYDSELANLAVEIKKQQAKVTQFLTEENIDNLRIMEELKIVQDLVEGWIEFDTISEVMAEGEQGNEKE
ncbi:hypothetical protein DB321_07405 [Ligilactobacillus salivarius]|uniref:Uncharacterized protein n=3 Tax=Ligilactobacillus salivarius TaxID=1624 RepID=C2EIF6_9LACO|nr:hypothetical protein HMPREF0545_1428 [Ligilactobacillus salivarius DSM 20555 = ATCC 11741]PTR95304.1 hypothetical protein DBP89_06705 [Ligilactobacillus salivarius]PTS01248.1 hypothetical protein DBP87_07860 [Ligilactobacillus salivarius]PTU88863.1 hypothetical protein DB322_07150 [Ligilactobacillus salivarius]PTU91079.1 hypothetical protein DB321_07405 [Ligilactobacillus salivarius]